MALIISPNEVLLNSVHYPLAGTGMVHPIWNGRLPPKLVTGDYSFESDPEKSTWVILGQGMDGSGVWDMDEEKQAKRFWWSSVDARRRGHAVLPTLATSTSLPADMITDGGMEIWTDATTLTNWTTAVGTLARSTDEYAGTYAAELTSNPSAPGALRQAISNAPSTSTVTVKARVKAANSIGRIGISVNGGAYSYSSYTTGTGSYELLSVAASTTSGNTLTVECASAAGSNAALFDSVDIIGTGFADMENFNGHLYIAYGRQLLKINGSTGALSRIALFPTEITALKASLNSRLYILLGDSDEYWSMNTSEALTESNKTNAYYAVEWDAKFFVMNTAGLIAYSTDPESATPTFTGNGTITQIPSGSVKNLYVDVDANGNSIIYAATTSGLWAHDYTNAVWEKPKLQIPTHTSGGRGACVWQDGAFISAGLDVYKYLAADPAQIISMGISEDDGLDSEYDGHITALIPGFSELYAAIDATLGTADTRYSSLMAYNNKGWRTIWADTTDGGVALGAGILSSAYAHRLWFTAGSTIYYIPLATSITNPLFFSGQTYATSANYYSPWFDASWKGTKIAHAIKFDCGGLTAANQDIIPYYRINRSSSVLSSGWTTMIGSPSYITANGETTRYFPSTLGATGTTRNRGLAFRAVQFRFYFSTSSSTASPDLFSAVLEYEKVLPARWSWAFEVDCTKEYRGRSSQQLLDALVTAAEVETLIPLQMHGSTIKYVRVVSVEGAREPGTQKYTGTYRVVVTEK